jgi:hypothetical protein
MSQKGGGMRKRGRTWMTAVAGLAMAASAGAASRQGFSLVVAVDGERRPEYRHRGTTYIEALHRQEYTLRLTNPTGERVAVALAVDGLNTIDARRTDARGAAKWVLEPHGSVEISGWQVSGSEARRFFFTTEGSSYGAWLGETDNLGVIEAVFYREQARAVPVLGHVDGAAREKASRQAAPSAEAKAGGSSTAPDAEARDYAATGIGDRVEHQVRRVHLDLEEEPAAVVRVRYEFRPQLVALGVLPPLPDYREPMGRRERARGFDGWYCPDPGYLR